MPQIKSFLKNTFVLDEYRSVLVAMQPMKHARADHVVLQVGEKIYNFGGMAFVQGEGKTNKVESLNSCEVYNIKRDEWRFFQPMNISKCAFSATVVNNKFIYTFGGYDGQNRLDAIERYCFANGDWLTLKMKLKFPLSNCACFCPEPDKVVVFGGGFSSCLLYTSPSPRDVEESRMPSSA